MTIYHDSANPALAVGQTLYSIAECNTYFQNNFQALRDQIEVTLGLVPQWKRDMQAKGVVISVPVLSDKWKPLPWTITRIVTHPTGFQSLYLECEPSHRHSSNLTIQGNEIEGAFVASFENYVSERMQSTEDKMIADAESFRKSEESKRAAKNEVDLKEAKRFLARDAAMPDFQREAWQTDANYRATMRNASNLITTSMKSAQQKVADSKHSAEIQARGKRSADSQLGLARAHLSAAQGRLKRANPKGGDLAELEADLGQRLADEHAAQAAVAKFQC
jgi:hypothetical protein